MFLNVSFVVNIKCYSYSWFVLNFLDQGHFTDHKATAEIQTSSTFMFPTLVLFFLGGGGGLLLSVCVCVCVAGVC